MLTLHNLKKKGWTNYNNIRIKSLEINLTKEMKDLYNEQYKTYWKKLKI